MTAIPSSMRLEPKPEAINAYRRRCSTNATSSNPYPSRGTIKIPLDTAFPGSMLDTTQTELAFSLLIKNSNPFVDYFNLPKCGMNAFIKEFRLMVNGNAVEKNIRYGLAFEDAMNKMGINSEPYELFRQNQWCPTDSRFHINMIKPSMVDAMGNPMYRQALFQDEQQQDQFFFGHANSGDATVIYSRNDSGTDVSNSTVSYFGSQFGQSASDFQETQNHFSFGTRLSPHAGALNLAYPQNNLGQLFVYGASTSTPLDVVDYEGAGYNQGNHTLSTPADWPFYQPGKAKRDPCLSSSRWQDIARFYANVKNIPIGMFKTWSAPSGAIASLGQNCFNTDTVSFDASSSANLAVTEFRVSTPLLSGILGLLTDKFFPDMLVAAGKMWIELDLQPKEVALQLLMDPCRRIPGTIRDYIPYTGRLATKTRDAALPAPTTGTDPSSYYSNVNSFIGSQMALIMDVASNSTELARNSRLCYNEGMCIGAAGFNGIYVDFASQAAGDLTPLSPTYSTTGTDVTLTRTQAIVAATGLPIPQYCFADQMYLKKSADKAPQAFIGETAACYGTYLKGSVAQVRRTIASTNSSRITTNYSSYDTDYEITNVILYTEQIIVPDEIASQLLLSARSGAISYHTTMIGATYNNAPVTSSQNLILTVTGASVNNVTFLFQSNAQLSGPEAYAYNSFATYNPWTKLDFSAAATATQAAADVGGTYELTNPLYTTNNLGFNLYVKIGNEMIPRQPINDIPSFLVETQKGMQTLSDYAIKLDMKMSVVPTYSTNSSVSYLQYDVLQDGFLACFVEAKALDDQTLTGNPYLNIIGAGEYSGTSNVTSTPIAAIRRGFGNYVNSNTPLTSYTGVLNAFKPYEGNFRMCFNLATFETQTSARCGTPIVNNQLFLQGEKFNFMSHKVNGSTPTVAVTALYEQDAKVVFEQGGNCLVFM